MFLVFIVLLLAMKIGMCVAHVFCQDSHATDWTPLGYSCPITCAAVIAAVKRLKEIDYEDLITAQPSPFSPKMLNFTMFELDDSAEGSKEIPEHMKGKQVENSMRSRILRSRNDIETRRLSPLHYRELYKTLSHKRSGNELRIAFKSAVTHLRNDTCQLFKKGKDKIKLLNVKCSRRSIIQQEFLKKFTEILNKHTTPDFFNNQLTARILDKILGDDADMRLGRLDVQKILNRLSQVITSHKQHARAASHTITLKSKYCINVYVPGCFCIPGFVEQNGQCVLPPDCFPGLNTVQEYLARIHVQ